MTWLAFIAAIRSLPSGSTSQANTATASTSAACGHALNIGPSQRPVGRSISANARREVRRDSRTYLARKAEKHTILARGLK